MSSQKCKYKKLICTQTTTANKKCNKIIVLKDGKIIEAGNHEELIMNPKGYYYQINYKQNKKNQ